MRVSPRKISGSVAVTVFLFWITSLFTDTNLYRRFIRRLIVLAILAVIGGMCILATQLAVCLHHGSCS